MNILLGELVLLAESRPIVFDPWTWSRWC